MKRDPAILLRLERRRVECAQLLCAITTDEGSRYAIPGALHRSGFCKWRGGDGSNPVFRVAVLLEAMAQAGATRGQMEAVVAHLQGIIEELRPAHDMDVTQAIRAAQAADSSEDFLETLALLDPAQTNRWIESKLLHIGDEYALIAAVRAQQGQRREWKAAA